VSWYFLRWGGGEKDPSLDQFVEVHCQFELSLSVIIVYIGHAATKPDKVNI